MVKFCLYSNFSGVFYINNWLNLFYQSQVSHMGTFYNIFVRFK